MFHMALQKITAKNPFNTHCHLLEKGDPGLIVYGFPPTRISALNKIMGELCRRHQAWRGGVIGGYRTA